ncbi:putative Cupin type-2 domain-containing protein [Seiridium cardinale]|uniref:Cupin type-2 domain-containing protein n=1 Tax=Seiridium cardinale TaxID=138064 RepID=A0ABR2Y822_9PEZI
MTIDIAAPKIAIQHSAVVVDLNAQAFAMPQRTDYTTQTIFSRPAPAAVTYDLSIPNQATITLPPKSTWTSGPHWHETHTEFLRVLSGAAEVTLSGAVLPSVTRDDGIVTVPRGAVHEWRRSRAANGGEDLVVREWTHPGDGAKEVFFRNLNGMVLDFVKQQEAASKDEQQMAWLSKYWQECLLQVEFMSLFWRCDNWPVFLDQYRWPMWAQTVVTKGWLRLNVFAGFCTGRKGIYQEYSH